MNLSEIDVPRFNATHGVPEMTQTGLGYWVKYEDAAKVVLNLRRKLVAAYAVAATTSFIMAAVLINNIH